MSGTQFETIDLRVAVFLGRLNGQVCCLRGKLAGATGLEPAASCVTGRRSNQLNYAPAYYVVWSLPIPSRSLSFHLAVP